MTTKKPDYVTREARREQIESQYAMLFSQGLSADHLIAALTEARMEEYAEKQRLIEQVCDLSSRLVEMEADRDGWRGRVETARGVALNACVDALDRDMFAPKECERNGCQHLSVVAQRCAPCRAIWECKHAIRDAIRALATGGRG